MINFDYKDAFCGFFDTDGSIRIAVINRQKKEKKYKIPLGFETKFCFSQSSFNSGVFTVLESAFCEKETFFLHQRFRWRKQVENKEVVTSTFFQSSSGKEMQAILENKGLFHPKALNDFLLAKKVNDLLKAKTNYTPEGLVTLVYLAYKTSNESDTNSTIIKKQPIENHFKTINATQDQLSRGIAEGEKHSELILQKVNLLKERLPKTRLKADYMIGAHYGDGSLYMVYDWSLEAISTRPVWSITDPSMPYLEAFKFSTKTGQIHGVGKSGNCAQFIVNSQKDATEVVLPLFKDKPLPFYKKNQFCRFKLGVIVLYTKRHTTLNGTKLLLRLTYKMSNNTRRKHSKKELLNIFIKYRKKHPGRTFRVKEIPKGW